MPFTLPLTPGQTGTWAELRALGSAAHGAMVDDPNSVTGSLDGPAPIGQWIVTEGGLRQGPRLHYPHDEPAPWCPGNTRRLRVVSDHYDPLEHVVAGGYIGAADLWDVIARAGTMLDGAVVHCSHDYGLESLNFQGLLGGRTSYYVIGNGGFVRGSLRGNTSNSWVRDADAAREVAGFWFIAWLPATWDPAALFQGPLPLPVPTRERPRCPLCRGPVSFYPDGTVHQERHKDGCHGATVGQALRAFAISETCHRCHRPAWRSDMSEAGNRVNSRTVRECRECHGKRMAGNMNGVPADILRFGVEVETEGISYEAQARDLAGKLPGRLGIKWDARHDGSLRGPHAEMCSPPMAYSEASLNELKEGVRAIRRAGGMVSERCGLHVHVDVSALTPRHLAALARHWHAAQRLLLTALPVHSYRRHFCESISAGTVETAMYLAARGINTARDWAGLTPRRYATLNFAAIARHGTVEFRMFNGTVHAGKIAAYVRLVVNFVSWASRNSEPEATVTERPATREGMLTLLSDLGIDCPSARWHLLGAFATNADKPRAPEVRAA